MLLDVTTRSQKESDVQEAIVALPTASTRLARYLTNPGRSGPTLGGIGTVLAS